PLKQEHEAAEKNVASLEALLKDARTADKAEVAKKLEEGKKKLVAEVTPRFKRKTEEKDNLTSSLAWWKDRRDPLALEAARLKRRIDNLEDRKKKIARVAVWTDDYSNLLSVTNR